MSVNSGNPPYSGKPFSGKLILASQSPRRRQLLEEAQYQFEILVPSDGAETDVEHGETPSQLVSRLATQKAADVARRIDSGLVLGCDTVAECNDQILGKPKDRCHAGEMLKLMRGNEHRVYSGLCLWSRPTDNHCVRVATTVLRMDPLSDDDIENYLESGKWEGKAGGFGYQDQLGWIHIIDGSESNVVGLPLELLAQMLRDV